MSDPVFAPRPSIKRDPEMLQPKETSIVDSKEDVVKSEDHHDNPNEYVTGIKLVLIVASVALACFLMLLDTMVVSTVSKLFAELPRGVYSLTRWPKGDSTYHRYFQLASRCWLVCQRVPVWQVRGFHHSVNRCRS